METKQLIEQLEIISREFMKKKEFFKAGRINLAINTINEVLPQALVIKSVCEHNGRTLPDPLGEKYCIECGCFVDKE